MILFIYLLFMSSSLTTASTQYNSSSPLLFTGDDQPKPDLGINAGTIDSGMSQWVFTNMFKHASEWRPVSTNNNWASYLFAGAVTTVFSSDGYPINSTSNIGFETELGTHGTYPTGDYILTFQGSGNISLFGDAKNVTIVNPNKFQFTVITSTTTGIIIIITKPNITNIDLRQKQDENSTDTFHRDYINAIQPFKAIRFSPWMVNRPGNTIPNVNTDWSYRRPVTYYTQVGQSMVSIEYIIELANLLSVDVWLSIPSSANTGFIANLSQHIQTGINNSTNIIYIEQSSDKGFNNNNRSLQMQLVTTCKSIFGNDTRVKYVLSTWQYAYYENTIAMYTAADLKQFDYYSIAGDLSYGAAYNFEGFDVTSVSNFNTSTILGEIRQQIFKDEISWIYQVQKLALQLNIPLIAYNFGFLVHAPGFYHRFRNLQYPTQEQQLEDLIIESIRQSIVKDLYLDAMERWWKVGGGRLFLSNIVDYVNRCPTGGGTCGYHSVLETLLQTPASVPKYQAALEWMAGNTSNLPFTSADLPKPVLLNCTDCQWGTCYNGTCNCFDGYIGANCRQIASKYLDCASNGTYFGVNLDGLADWSSEVAFVDLHRRARKWIVDQVAYSPTWAAYNQSNVTLRDDGYPQYLEIAKTVGTILTRDLQGHYVNGRYVCLYDGDGVLNFNFDANNIISREAGRIVLQITHSTDFNNGIFYQILRTNPSNPIRNVRFVEEVYENVYEYFPFHPLFLSILKKYQTIRFMTWSNIEYDEYVDWSNRTLDSFYTFTLNTGVSLEKQVLLINTLGTNGWFNVPHKATDDYIRNFAIYLRDHVRPDVKIYIEQGNECWGTATNCGIYANKMGTQLNVTISRNQNLYSADLQGRICFHAQVMKHYSDIITSVFGAQNRTRIKFVINTQVAWAGPINVLFLCRGNLSQIYDVVAVAPYLSANLGNYTAMTIDEFYSSSIIPNAITSSANQLASIASIVSSYAPSMELATYEGGPDFSSLTDTNNLAMTQLSYKIHRDSRIGQALTDYISNLTNIPGVKLSLYNHFTSVGSCSKYGCWGLKESSDALLDNSPKYKAYIAFIDSKSICRWNEKQSICPNSCSSTGVCTSSPFSNKDDTCYCYFNYNGTACDSFSNVTLSLCTYQCGGKGNCSYSYTQGYYSSNYQGYYAVNTCGCNQGYYGYGCSLFTCTNECNYNGLCVDYNKCSCYRGFKGQFCDIDCGCNSHGICSNTTNNCICDEGYSYIGGKCRLDCTVNSSRTECLSCPNCGNGTCIRGSCVCWAGYTLDSRQTCSILTSAPNDGSKLGMNVAGVVDWSPQWAFVDLVKPARQWIMQYIDNLNNLYIWSLTEPVNLTTDGYPSQVPSERQIVTIMLRDVLQTWPNGIYHVFYDGEGVIEFAFDSTTVENVDKGRMKINVVLSKVLNNGVFMKIKKTNPRNPLRNIRIIMDGFEDTYNQFPFHPLFVQRLSMFKTIRFMPWIQQDGIVNWSDRITPSSFSQGQGVAFEYMIQLSNILKADPWLIVPYAASDDFVTQMAILVKNSLRKDVKVYLEYTNEGWNSAFNSGIYCQSMGLKLGLSTDPVVARNLYYSKRSVEIIKIWKSVFSSEDSRIVFVLGSFVLMPIMSTRILTYGDAYKAHSNVMIAITGYIGCGDPSAAQVAILDLSVLFAGCSTDLLNVKNYIQPHATIANTYKVGLGMYESGSGLSEYAAIFTGKGTPGATEKYIAMNRDSRMYQVFMDYYTMYNTFNLVSNNHYAYVDVQSVYGSWNCLEYQNQSISDAPKYRALLDIINQTRGPVLTYSTLTCNSIPFNSTSVCSGIGICVAQDQCVYSSIPTSNSDILIAPSQGTALTDNFYLSTSAWTSDVMLVYAFGMQHPVFGNIVLTDYSQFPSAITILPYIGQPFKIVVFVKNIFGQIYTSLSSGTVNVLKYNGSSSDFTALIGNATTGQKCISLVDTSQSAISTSYILNTITLTGLNSMASFSAFEKITSSLNSQSIMNPISSIINTYLSNMNSALQNNNFNSTLATSEITSISNIVTNLYNFGYSDLSGQIVTNLVPSLIMTQQGMNLSSTNLEINVANYNVSNSPLLKYADISANLTEIYTNSSNTSLTGILFMKEISNDTSQIGAFDQLTISFYSGASVLNVTDLANPILMSFKIYNNSYSYLTNSSYSVSLTCKFYDTQSNTWNGSGCTLNKLDINNKLVYCACNHTTSFKVFMEYTQNSSANNNVAIIVGSVIGAVLAIAVIAGLIYKHHKKQTKLSPKMNLLEYQDSNLTLDEMTVKRGKTSTNSSNLKYSSEHESQSRNRSALKMSREATEITMAEVKVE